MVLKRFKLQQFLMV